jgi:D-glycero-D-manno-heptose 1,7-bisphosphate phosphatase
MNKAVFLDRDGVLNEEIGDYVWNDENFRIPKGVPEALKLLKEAGYFLIVVTNQGGIEKGLYTAAHVLHLHQKLQKACGNLLDALYYAPHHRIKTLSLLNKPNSLMLEKGLAKFNIDPAKSWIVGDAERDMEAGHRVGVKGILVPSHKEQDSKFTSQIAGNLWEAAQIILSHQP